MAQANRNTPLRRAKYSLMQHLPGELGLKYRRKLRKLFAPAAEASFREALTGAAGKICVDLGVAMGSDGSRNDMVLVLPQVRPGRNLEHAVRRFSFHPLEQWPGQGEGHGVVTEPLAHGLAAIQIERGKLRPQMLHDFAFHGLSQPFSKWFPGNVHHPRDPPSSTQTECSTIP